MRLSSWIMFPHSWDVATLSISLWHFLCWKSQMSVLHRCTVLSIKLIKHSIQQAAVFESNIFHDAFCWCKLFPMRKVNNLYCLVWVASTQDIGFAICEQYEDMLDEYKKYKPEQKGWKTQCVIFTGSRLWVCTTATIKKYMCESRSWNFSVNCC